MKNYNAEVSALLESIIQEFNNNSIPYLFLRNYENYPDVITGDIDIIVNPNSINDVKNILNYLIKIHKWDIFFSSNNQRLLSYQLFRLDLPADNRNIIVIEIFKGFNLLGIEYLKYSWASKYIKLVNNLYAIQEPYNIILSIVHYFLRAGFYPEKYFERLELALKNKKKIEDCLTKIFSNSTARQLIRYIEEQDKSKFIKVKNIPERIRILPKTLRLKLRIQVMAQALMHQPIKTLTVLFGLLYEIICRIYAPSGSIIVSDIENSKNISELLFYEIKKVHLFKNSASILVDITSINIFQIIKSVSNGGAAIVFFNDKNNASFSDNAKLKAINSIYKNTRLGKLINNISESGKTTNKYLIRYFMDEILKSHKIHRKRN